MQNLSCDMYNEFYFNSFAFSLALKQRLEAIFTITAKGAEKRLEKLEGDMKLMQHDGIMMGTLDTLSLKMPK